jgi:hypothetical protein
VQFQKCSIFPLACAMSQLTHIGQTGKPWPLAALSHWLHITGTMRLVALAAHGHIDNGHMARHWLRLVAGHWLRLAAPGCLVLAGHWLPGCWLRGHAGTMPRAGPTTTGSR